MPTAQSFTVIAEFDIDATNRDAFLEACQADSLGSTGSEPGCSGFDVLLFPEDERLVVLYETYTDRAAFDAHQRTPHYADFAAAVERLGATHRQVRFLTRVFP